MFPWEGLQQIICKAKDDEVGTSHPLHVHNVGQLMIVRVSEWLHDGTLFKYTVLVYDKDTCHIQ